MSDKELKKVNVFEADGDDIPVKFIDFMELWKKQLDLIPEQYKKSAEISFNQTTFYGSPELEIELNYYRPLTDDEIQKELQLKVIKEETERREKLRLIQ